MLISTDNRKQVKASSAQNARGYRGVNTREGSACGEALKLGDTGSRV